MATTEFYTQLQQQIEQNNQVQRQKQQQKVQNLREALDQSLLLLKASSLPQPQHQTTKIAVPLPVGLPLIETAEQHHPKCREEKEAEVEEYIERGENNIPENDEFVKLSSCQSSVGGVTFVESDRAICCHQEQSTKISGEAKQRNELVAAAVYTTTAPAGIAIDNNKNENTNANGFDNSSNCRPIRVLFQSSEATIIQVTENFFAEPKIISSMIKQSSCNAINPHQKLVNNQEQKPLNSSSVRPFPPSCVAMQTMPFLPAITAIATNNTNTNNNTTNASATHATNATTTTTTTKTTTTSSTVPVSSGASSGSVAVGHHHHSSRFTVSPTQNALPVKTVVVSSSSSVIAYTNRQCFSSSCSSFCTTTIPKSAVFGGNELTATTKPASVTDSDKDPLSQTTSLLLLPPDSTADVAVNVEENNVNGRLGATTVCASAGSGGNPRQQSPLIIINNNSSNNENKNKNSSTGLPPPLAPPTLPSSTVSAATAIASSPAGSIDSGIVSPGACCDFVVGCCTARAVCRNCGGTGSNSTVVCCRNGIARDGLIDGGCCAAVSATGAAVVSLSSPATILSPLHPVLAPTSPSSSDDLICCAIHHRPLTPLDKCPLQKQNLQQQQKAVINNEEKNNSSRGYSSLNVDPVLAANSSPFSSSSPPSALLSPSSTEVADSTRTIPRTSSLRFTFQAISHPNNPLLDALALHHYNSGNRFHNRSASECAITFPPTKTTTVAADSGMEPGVRAVDLDQFPLTTISTVDNKNSVNCSSHIRTGAKAVSRLASAKLPPLRVTLLPQAKQPSLEEIVARNGDDAANGHHPLTSFPFQVPSAFDGNEKRSIFSAPNSPLSPSIAGNIRKAPARHHSSSNSFVNNMNNVIFPYSPPQTPQKTALMNGQVKQNGFIIKGILKKSNSSQNGGNSGGNTNFYLPGNNDNNKSSGYACNNESRGGGGSCQSLFSTTYRNHIRRTPTRFVLCRSVSESLLEMDKFDGSGSLTGCLNGGSMSQIRNSRGLCSLCPSRDFCSGLCRCVSTGRRLDVFNEEEPEDEQQHQQEKQPREEQNQQKRPLHSKVTIEPPPNTDSTTTSVTETTKTVFSSIETPAIVDPVFDYIGGGVSAAAPGDVDNNNTSNIDVEECSGENVGGGGPIGIAAAAAVAKLALSSRTISDDSGNESAKSASSRETIDGAEDDFVPHDYAPQKKRVSFSEHVQARIYRSNSSILGQKKKNERKARQKMLSGQRPGSKESDLEFGSYSNKFIYSESNPGQDDFESTSFEPGAASDDVEDFKL